MGEIKIDAGWQRDTSSWPPYMAGLLREVIQSWVTLVESGNVAAYVKVGDNKPTTEHLRVAKQFLASP